MRGMCESIVVSLRVILAICPVLLIFPVQPCRAQGYSYTSTYIWISGDDAYAKSITDSNYSSGAHDAWASTTIRSPSGRTSISFH